MSALISGVLINGAGIPLAECKIYLDALVNTNEVVTKSFAVIETDITGQYAFDAPEGKYTVHIKQKNGPKYCVGDISVYEDSKPGTLNDFLTALDEDDLKPDVVKRFEEMVAQAQQSAKAAAESEQQAGQHVSDAQKIQEDCQTLADNVRQDADAVAEDRQQVVNLASQVEETAVQVTNDADSAQKSASDAEQARDDIEIALSAMLKTANNLSEIATAGAEAQQDARDNLELKAAATMEPQSDIRDRTVGCLAVPGMYGFGQIFSSADALSFNEQTDFAEWLKEVTPGRYAVSIADSSGVFAGTTQFNGIIDVMWSPFDNDESDAPYKSKTALCFNQYYEGEHSIHCLRYWYSDNSWSARTNVIVYDGDSLAYLMASTSGDGPSSFYQYPAVGVPVLAVYQGTGEDNKLYTIGAGDIVPGSQLGPVAVCCSITNTSTCSSDPSVTAGGAGAFSFPGRYQALSGFRSTYTYNDKGFICLFVRVE